MGIDIYMSWDGMTRKDREAQYTGYRTDAGEVGYLREAYHGGPYATKVLVSEDWDTQPECSVVDKDGERSCYPDRMGKCDCGFRIPSEVLEGRLPDVIRAAIIRDQGLYQGESPVTGEITGGPEKVLGYVGVIFGVRIPEAKAQQRVGEPDWTRPFDKAAPKAFVDFVRMHKRLELEERRPRIVVSY